MFCKKSRKKLNYAKISPKNFNIIVKKSLQILHPEKK